MRQEKSVVVLTGLGLGVLLVVCSFLDADRKARIARPGIEATAELVDRYKLTDLVLFTEARYSRNLALTDRFSAFQDHPLAFEHFPSGSIVPPPKHLSRAP